MTDGPEESGCPPTPLQEVEELLRRAKALIDTEIERVRPTQISDSGRGILSAISHSLTVQADLVVNVRLNVFPPEEDFMT